MSQKITKEEALESVRKNPRSLCDLPVEFRADREVVLEAVKHNGVMLQYAAKTLWNDWEIVLAAVKQDGSSFRYASLLQGNHKFVITLLGAILEESNFLEAIWEVEQEEETKRQERLAWSNDDWDADARSEFYTGRRVDENEFNMLERKQRKDEEAEKQYLEEQDALSDAYYLQLHVEQSVTFLQCVSPDLWCDKAFVLEVVSRWPKGIEFASEKLKNNEDVILASRR